MKNLFYAIRNDRDGNKLTTSYTSSIYAKKYGGHGATIKETLYFAEDYTGPELKITDKPRDGQPVIRSILVNNGTVSGTSNGAFKLLGKKGGTWSLTPFSFDNYGNANSFMKAMIGMYEALAIISAADESQDPVAAFDEKNNLEMDLVI